MKRVENYHKFMFTFRIVSSRVSRYESTSISLVVGFVGILIQNIFIASLFFCRVISIEVYSDCNIQINNIFRLILPI